MPILNLVPGLLEDHAPEGRSYARLHSSIGYLEPDQFGWLKPKLAKVLWRSVGCYVMVFLSSSFNHFPNVEIGGSCGPF